MGRSPEYRKHIQSKQWRNHCVFCRGLWAGRDAIFPLLRSNHTHHLTYDSMGREVPIIDTIPVNKIIHKILHFPLLWKNKKMRSIVNLVIRAWALCSMIAILAFCFAMLPIVCLLPKK